MTGPKAPPPPRRSAPRAPLPSMPEELKETATLDGDELDALLDESQRPIGEETTNNVSADEIDRLLAEARGQMRSMPQEGVGKILDLAPEPVVTTPRASEPPPAPKPSEPPPAARFLEEPAPPPSAPLPPISARAPLSSVDLGTSEGAMANDARRRRLFAIGVVIVAVGLLGGLVQLATYEADTADAASPASATPASETTTTSPPSTPNMIVPATTTTTPIASGAPTSSTSAATTPPSSGAEAAARAALEQLRAGLDECVRHGIGALPGTSPPVPASLAATKGDGYTPAPGDWKTPVWACTKVHVDTAMRFVLQWQSSRPGIEGQGLVWVDSDGDGTADRVFGFHATKAGRGEIAVSPIGPVDPATKILPGH